VMAALRAADSPQPSASTCDLSQSSRLCLRSSPVLLNSRSASLPPPRPTASATFARVEMPIFKRPVWMPCGLQWLHLNIAASRQMNASASCTIQHSDRLHEIFFSFSSFSPLTTASIPPSSRRLRRVRNSSRRALLGLARIKATQLSHPPLRPAGLNGDLSPDRKAPTATAHISPFPSPHCEAPRVSSLPVASKSTYYSAGLPSELTCFLSSPRRSLCLYNRFFFFLCRCFRAGSRRYNDSLYTPRHLSILASASSWPTRLTSASAATLPKRRAPSQQSPWVPALPCTTTAPR
jgi:hypothetical protein